MITGHRLRDYVDYETTYQELLTRQKKNASQKKRAAMSTCATLSVNVTNTPYYFEYPNYHYIYRVVPGTRYSSVILV